ncbi:MAG: DUF1264 domain-containing protein [Nitrospirae bacterium]|nr:DUF1264 domain-containing protein [Nitrospirota bacterium]
MKKLCTISLLVFSFVVSGSLAISAEEKAQPLNTRPSEGWTLHIDAKKHIPKVPGTIAHHYCKQVSGGMTECQLYDSDRPDARLIGVEVVVDKETWKKFPKNERALWHYHKTELKKVDPALPDLSPEEGAKTMKSMEETYGKIYILWNPSKNDPVGRPMVSILP